MEIQDSEKFVYVEFDSTFQPIRIFRNVEQAKLSEAWTYSMVKAWTRRQATAAIRRRVFERDDWACVHCGDVIDWQSGHMHERQHRGQGGEISLENSVTLCYNCHLNDPVAGHGDRKPQFSNGQLSPKL